MTTILWVLIPAYNEEKTIEGIVRALLRKGMSVLVVDDGSLDATGAAAARAGATVLKNTVNLGKGLSLKKGIEYLMQHERFDAVVTMDGDGQHPPEEVSFLVYAMEQGASFVVGNRMGNPQGMPWIRVATNRVMSFFISMLCGQYISDTQCGFRLIRKNVLQEIFIMTKNFEVESELLLKASRKRIRIVSVPISSIYSHAGVSNIRPFKDTFRFIAFILRWHLKETFFPKKKNESKNR